MRELSECRYCGERFMGIGYYCCEECEGRAEANRQNAIRREKEYEEMENEEMENA